MEISVGKFYRFKPRNQWPPALQQSIAQERLYFTHPVIVLDEPIGGLVNLVTTTSSPALATNPANYIRISDSEEKRLTDLHAPFLVNHKLPKESWVVLDSKRVLPGTILEPWVESKVHLALARKTSRRRLRERVKGRMEVISHQAQLSAIEAVQAAAAPPPPPPEPTKNPYVITSTNPWARAMAPSGPPPSIPLPLLPQPSLPPTRTTPQISAGVVATTGPYYPDLDVRGIKTSLAGLKVAVTALEGLCEKLEQKLESTPPAPPPHPASPEHTPNHTLRDDKAARTLGINRESVIATEKEADGMKAGKVARLKRWGSRFFMTRED